MRTTRVLLLIEQTETDAPDEESGVIETTGELVHRARPIRKAYAPPVSTLALGGRLARLNGWIRKAAS